MTARINPADVGINVVAFLDMIAISEIGSALLESSDDGYNVLVGGTTFDSYADHPRIKVTVRPGLVSTAAGRYQELARNYDHYKGILSLPDFSPESQDRIALQQIHECRALPLIKVGNIPAAIQKCAHIWASFPGAGYDQPENSMAKLISAYIKSGGELT